MQQTRDLCVGRLDGLVLCAGLGPNAQPAIKITAVNYFGTVAILDGLLPLLQSGVNAAAVVVSSIASVQMPWHRNPLAAALKSGNESEVERLLDMTAQKASMVAYCASKNALTVAVRQRALAWGQAGVRLNTVAPGSVDTPMQQATLTDPELTESIHKNVAPLGRIAKAEEIADLIAFLLSARSSYVHGAQWMIDGGKDAMIRSTQF